MAMQTAVTSVLKYTLPAVITAVVTGFVTIRQSEIGAKVDFEKARLGVEALAEQSNEHGRHNVDQDKDIAALKGHMESVEGLLMQLVLAGQNRPAAAVGSGYGVGAGAGISRRPAPLAEKIRSLVNDPALKARPSMQQKYVPSHLDDIASQRKASL